MFVSNSVSFRLLFRFLSLHQPTATPFLLVIATVDTATLLQRIATQDTATLFPLDTATISLQDTAMTSPQDTATEATVTRLQHTATMVTTTASQHRSQYLYQVQS